MPALNASVMREPGHRRDNVELTADCGGLLDQCAQHLDTSGGGGLVRWRSHLSETGLLAFARVAPDRYLLSSKFQVAANLIIGNYRLIHADGKETGYAITYSPQHHEDVESLSRYFPGRRMIYLRRAALALGLADQNYINILNINIGANLRIFLTNLRAALR